MKLPLLTICLTLVAAAAQASDVNLTADQKVEWHQKSQKIVAVGNAVATKDDMNIKADRLIGYYAGRQNTAKGKSKITKVEARGNVAMHSPKADAFGSAMDYDLVQDVVILRGEPAKIKTDTETICAEDNITYYPSQQKAVAFGNVIAVDKDSNRIFADKMVAYFIKSGNNDNTSGLTLDKVEISGNVKIKTPNADVSSDRGTYLPRTGKIKLYDHIVIEQNGNILKGDLAETDLNTGISKLLSSAKQRRVKGVFKEKQEKDKKKASEQQAPKPDTAKQKSETNDYQLQY